MNPVAIPEQARLRLRALLEQSTNLFGLDAIDVRVPMDADAPIALSLQFIRPSPGVERPTVPPGLGKKHIRIHSLMPERAPLRIDSMRTLGSSIELQISADVVRSGQYRLEIHGIEGLSPYFASGDVSLDGETLPPWPVVSAVEDDARPGDVPPADYLARDYASFLTMLQDGLAAAAPQWKERHPADIGVMITEVLAYIADQLSYYQDAVATEAYLGTARLRASVARHARLQGYRVRQPVAPRTWVAFEVERDTTVPVSSLLVSYMTGMPTCLTAKAVEERLRYANTKHVFFETLYDAPLSEHLNRIALHTWGLAQTEIPAGATATVLVGSYPELGDGRLLIFHSDDPTVPACCVRLNRAPRLLADPLSGIPLTEIGWHEADAPASAMTIQAASEGVATIVACGNVVLAEQGRSVLGEQLATPEPGVAYRPALLTRNVLFHAPWMADKFEAMPATLGLETSSENPIPAILLRERRSSDGQPQSFFARTRGSATTWHGVPDILNSAPSERAFAAELEEGRVATLRFGDGQHGRVPHSRADLLADYRVAELEGLSRNLLVHIVDPTLPILRVTNPFSVAVFDGESLEHTRLLAPTASRRRTSCILSADYVARLKEEPEVLQAVACARTERFVQCHVLLRNGVEFTPALRERLEERLMAHARIGVAVQVLSAVRIPLEAEITLLHRSREERVIALAAREALAGFFSPERLSFGKALYASELVEHLQRLKTVEAVTVQCFRELGSSQDRIVPVILPPSTGVVVMRNDPRRPSLGTLHLNFHQDPLATAWASQRDIA